MYVLAITNVSVVVVVVCLFLFFTSVIVKYMKKNLDITKPRNNEQNVLSPLALCYIEVPLSLGGPHWTHCYKMGRCLGELKVTNPSPSL